MRDCRRVILSWSSGKDSAWALHRLRSGGGFDVVGLITTTNAVNGRVSMHGTEAEVLQAQAEAAGLPLFSIPIPWPCSNEQYEAAMAAAFVEARARWEVDSVAFGDLYLEDVRRYREERCAAAGWNPVFPLWGIPTRRLADEMIAGGLTARVGCIDKRKLPLSFVGREFDPTLLADLPEGIDPCAENGEFHTVAAGGPMFTHPVALESHGIYEDGDFAWADLRRPSH